MSKDFTKFEEVCNTLCLVVNGILFQFTVFQDYRSAAFADAGRDGVDTDCLGIGPEDLGIVRPRGRTFGTQAGSSLASHWIKPVSISRPHLGHFIKTTSVGKIIL